EPHRQDSRGGIPHGGGLVGRRGDEALTRVIERQVHDGVAVRVNRLRHAVAPEAQLPVPCPGGHSVFGSPDGRGRNLRTIEHLRVDHVRRGGVPVVHRLVLGFVFLFLFPFVFAFL